AWLTALTVAALALHAPASSYGQCTTDADCASQGKICVDGSCVRPGARNPFDAPDFPSHLPRRRDHEIFWVAESDAPVATGASGGSIDLSAVRYPLSGFVMTPQETFLSPNPLRGQPVASSAGRVLGTALEQAVLVSRNSNLAMPSGSHTLRVHSLMDVDARGSVEFGSPVAGEYRFDADPSNPHIAVAVGDLDMAREDYPSNEYHAEVAQVYQDPQVARPRLVVMSFEDSEPGQPAPPARTSTVLVDVPLLSTTPSHLAVAIGDFLPDEQPDVDLREIAVAGFDDVEGEVVIWFYNVVTQPDGSLALEEPMSPDSGSASLFNYTTGQPNRAFDLIGGRFDDLTDVSGAQVVGGREQLVFANLGTSDGFIQARTIYPRKVSGNWFWGSIGRSRYSADSVGMHGPSGDAVQPLGRGRLILSKGRFPGGEEGFGNDQACLFYDTNYGPVMQLIGFSSEPGAPVTGPYHGNTLVWPRQADLNARARQTDATRSYGIGGNFLEHRAERMSGDGNLGRSRIYVSFPEAGVPLSYGYVDSGGGFVGGSVVPVLDENGQELHEPFRLLLGLDVDGDNAYKRFPDAASGDVVYAGLGTRYSIAELVTLETVLQEPPKHVDYLPPLYTTVASGMLNVSQKDDFYVEFSSQTTSEETLTKEIQTDERFGDSQSLSVSGEVTVGIEGNSATVKASHKGTMKSAREDSTGYFSESASTVTLTSLARTESDDQLTLEAQSFDTWRYPAMGVVTVDEMQNELPLDEQPTSPTFEITFPGAPVKVSAGGRSVDAYQPLHINGNLMGYPSYDVAALTPGDMGSFEVLNDTDGDGVPDVPSTVQPPAGTPLWANQEYLTGSVSTHILQYSSSDMGASHSGSKDTFRSSDEWSVGAVVEGSSGYVSGTASVTQKYTTKQTHSVAKANTSSNLTALTTQMKIELPTIGNSNYNYGFMPVWYFTGGGGIKVAHSVSTTAAGSQSDWDTIYGRPDPALNLPNRIVSHQSGSGWVLNDGVSRQRAKGILIRDEAGDGLVTAPEAGDGLLITARVYNLSTVTPAIDVRVRFQAQEVVTDQTGPNEVGPRIFLGDRVIPCIASHGDGASCGSTPGAGGPNNMAEVTYRWDTTGFGPGDGASLRDWRIYVVLDPLDTIEETHELRDRFNDPLLGANGQPLDSLEKGQNNTGYTEVSIGEPIEGRLAGSTYAPDVWVDASSLELLRDAGPQVVGTSEPTAGTRYRFRGRIRSSAIDRRVSNVTILETGPDGTRRALAVRQLNGIDAKRGATVDLEWVPEQPGLHTLSIQVAEPASDPQPGNASASLAVRVARTR
ncbi:MAG: hypothetical protein AAGG01_00550, partial [Planctomycetota bacterium]